MPLTPLGSDPANWSGTHIEFTVRAADPKRKTARWDVFTNRGDGDYLGCVAWFSRWRKYCFYPERGCVFEQTCLGEIAEFITARTREHKTGI